MADTKLSVSSHGQPHTAFSRAANARSMSCVSKHSHCCFIYRVTNIMGRQSHVLSLANTRSTEDRQNAGVVLWETVTLDGGSCS